MKSTVRTSVIAIVLSLFISTTALSKDGLTARSLNSCRDFTSVEEIGETFQYMETDYPDIARRVTIGTSLEGRPLFGIRLSVDPDEESMEPEARIIGAMHGNECMGTEVSMLAAQWLTNGYGDDAFVTRLLENAEVVIIPLMNPDGYSAENASRYNANNVDLNRNLYFAWVGDGPRPFSEPETRALRDFSEDNAFTLGISYHTVANYVNSSWNYTSHHPPDEELFQTIGEGYAGDSSFEVVFGWDWYNIQGDVNDWSLGTAGTFDWTLELISDTENQWDVNGQGIKGFLSFLLQGVQGTVTDADTLEPLAARISVSPTGAPIFTDNDVGDYNRLLLPGTYDLTAYAEGYAPKTVEDVVVHEDAMSRLDFALSRYPNAETFAFKVQGMSLPHPIATAIYTGDNPYLNETMVWDALGPPDGKPYSLSAYPDADPSVDVNTLKGPVGSVGSITLDMGENTWVVDRDGAEIRVVSATNSDEPAAIAVSVNQDGPFVVAASSNGSFDVDIHDTGFSAIRYVRVVDLTDGEFNDPSSGYDLDAVVNLSVGNGQKTNEDGGVPLDTDTDTDSGSDQQDGGEIIGGIAGGCGCRMIGTADPAGAMGLINSFFVEL
jgi:carboxypeptidase D